MRKGEDPRKVLESQSIEGLSKKTPLFWVVLSKEDTFRENTDIRLALDCVETVWQLNSLKQMQTIMDPLLMIDIYREK
ncbi:hypothetical protein VNO77_04252 [Canavalia gladiata]|uniref:Uncharacterized protein n=1 Tax=Canavalia gladiata TaxID=3824 RepID=A0AAN9R8W3_CANGL